jgi:Zn-dependent protease
LAALATYYVARTQDSDLLLALSYAEFFLNLFNLIPLAPFDGGRVTAVISPRFWLIGAPNPIALFFYRPSSLLILMVRLSSPHIVKAWRGIEDREQPYYEVSCETRFTYGPIDHGLVGFLAIMCDSLHQALPRAF